MLKPAIKFKQNMPLTLCTVSEPTPSKKVLHDLNLIIIIIVLYELKKEKEKKRLVFQ